MKELGLKRKPRIGTTLALQHRPGVDEVEEALALVYGDRQADYGHPRDSYAAVAKVWSGILAPILKQDITAGQAVLLMAALKIQREANQPKRDNVVDLHGYGVVYSRVTGGRE